MKIKFGGGIVAASGKIAGNVFSRNASGAYVRAWAMPSNPNTEPQQLARSRFGTVSIAWLSLTPEQQAGWNAAAIDFPTLDALGQTVILSGQQLFNHLNGSLAQIGASTIVNAPAPGEVIGVTSINMDTTLDDNATYTITMTDTMEQVPAGHVNVIEATRSLSSGKTTAKRPDFRYIKQAAASSATSEVDLETAWNTVFGSMQVGSKIFVRTFNVLLATGQRSAAASTSFVVTT